MEKDIKDKLKECEDRYQAFAENSIDAIISSDKSDKIITWNRGAEEIFFYGQDIIGKPVIEIIPEHLRKKHSEGVKRFLKTGEKRLIGKKVELTGLREDGIEIPVELSLSSWEGSSGIIFGAIIRDISDRKHIERVRQNINRMMRHDLKSPLIGITGLAGVILKDRDLKEKHRKSALLIKDTGKKMLRFIGRTKDLFMIEQGAYDLKPSRISLPDLLNRISVELAPLKKKKNIFLDIKGINASGKDKEQTYLYGDENLVEVMLANLIKNALEASPADDSITIGYSEKEKNGAKYHCIDIHNKGTVPEDIRSEFFKPYTTSGKKSGTGLGTYSALLVAQAHKGHIDFSTSEAEGTKITVYLPVEVIHPG